MLNVFYTSQPIMGKQLTNLAFEQWVKHVFDHPVPVDKTEKATNNAFSHAAPRI
jgi:hypothetical protein